MPGSVSASGRPIASGLCQARPDSPGLDGSPWIGMWSSFRDRGPARRRASNEPLELKRVGRQIKGSHRICLGSGHRRSQYLA